MQRYHEEWADPRAEKLERGAFAIQQGSSTECNRLSAPPQSRHLPERTHRSKDRPIFHTHQAFVHSNKFFSTSKVCYIDSRSVVKQHDLG